LSRLLLKSKLGSSGVVAKDVTQSLWPTSVPRNVILSPLMLSLWMDRYFTSTSIAVNQRKRGRKEAEGDPTALLQYLIIRDCVE
jgi:hypothetical protein